MAGTTTRGSTTGRTPGRWGGRTCGSGRISPGGKGSRSRTGLRHRQGPRAGGPHRRAGRGNRPFGADAGLRAPAGEAPAGCRPACVGPRGHPCLPFGSGAFSAVMAPYGILQSLTKEEDLAATLTESARVLRRGGTLGVDLVPDLPAWDEYPEQNPAEGSPRTVGRTRHPRRIGAAGPAPQAHDFRPGVRRAARKTDRTAPFLAHLQDAAAARDGGAGGEGRVSGSPRSSATTTAAPGTCVPTSGSCSRRGGDIQVAEWPGLCTWA